MQASSTEGEPYLKNDLTGPLPLGELESLALPYESYQLALTSGQVSALVAETQTLSGTALDPAVLTGEGAYVLRNGDYWAPSGRVIFDAQHFFLPIEAVDAFGNQAFVEWDEFSLLVKKTCDALGNATVATNDYRVLAPKQIQDPNLNRVQVAFDALGMVVATAVLGKEGSTDGDTLNDPTTRIEYDLLAFQDGRGPAFVHSFAREKHGAENPRWQETYTYSDGFGRVVQTKVQAEPGEVPGIAEPVSERWVGTGRTVFNNKGNPVKQYEPFFSATPAFEDETEIVENGVTPILRYDSLDRLVQTDLPDGTFTKVVFDSWRQENWDQNDTVLESAWYVKWHSPDPDGIEPTEPHERAAWLSAQHAETPTVTHLDTLGRPFLSVAHNKTGTRTNRVETFYRTRTQLDIEGNTLAIYDARQHSTSAENDSMNGSGVYANIRQTFDVLGRRLKVVSSDAGVRLSVQDVAGKPLRGWDSRGHVMRGRYDALQRPTHSFVSKGTTETLVQRMVYGEALDPSGPSGNPASPSPAQLRNLRGQVHLVFDSAGRVKSEEHDFKGNLLRANRRLTKNYQTTPDWSALATLTDPASIESAASGALETEVFETETEFDALNRVTLAKSPASQNATLTPQPSVTRPTYNEANLLEQVHVSVRGAAEQLVVAGLDYNARGQRTACDHANPTTGATSHSIEYTYDEKTFRLVRLVTTRMSDGVTLQDLRYFFDAVGNITEVQDRAEAQEASRGIIFSGTDPVSGDGKYEYDALYRLTKAEGREHPGQQPADGEPTLGSVPHANDLSALERYTEEFAYDEVGNIQSVAHSAASTNWTRRYSYAEDSNRLLATSLPGDLPNQLSATYTHNEHGSMLSMPHLQEMNWDYAERLQHTLKSSGSGQHTYFTYDASGERVRKVYEHNGVVEERIYLGGFEIYRKWEAAVGGTLKLERETLHTMDDQRRVAMVETKTWDTIAITNPAELWRFQLGNHLDSASLELDESSGVLTYEEYHPYGSTAFRTARSGAEVSAKRYRYTGKERDEETGLYYHGARYYAAWLGRWTAADPAGLVDGLNLYRYSRDNPINFSDPGGTQSCDPNLMSCEFEPEEEVVLASLIESRSIDEPTERENAAKASLPGEERYKPIPRKETPASKPGPELRQGKASGPNRREIGEAVEQTYRAYPEASALGVAVIEYGLHLYDLAATLFGSAEDKGDLRDAEGNVLPSTGVLPEERIAAAGMLLLEVSTMRGGGSKSARTSTALELNSSNKMMGIEKASPELLESVASRRTIEIVAPGSEEMRYLDFVGAEANVGGPNMDHILLRPNPSKAAVLEEFLHGTQQRVGVIDRLGTTGAETHVKDFMIRHKKILGLSDEDVRILQILKDAGL